MSTLEGLATALESVVGSAYLLTNAAVAEYAIDGVPPVMVVFPADEAQITDVLRLASEYRATVFPRGGGSHTFVGQPHRGWIWCSACSVWNGSWPMNQPI